MWQMFIRVYRLEMQSVLSVFSTHHRNCYPSPLLFCPTLPPLSCVNKYTVCKGGHGVLGLRQINTCRKVPLHVNVFR